MTERISLIESYDNKDVITQIFRMADIVEKGTYKELVVSRDGNNIKFIFTTNDDQVHTYSVPDAGITNVSGSSQGSQVTITFTMTDGTTRSFTYTATGGVTIDTDQTISGMKVFSGETTQFTHEVDIGGVLNVADTAEVNSLEVDTTATVDGNLEVGGDAKITGKLTDDVVIASTHDLEFEGAGAIEPSNSDLVISPTGRLLVKTSNGQDLEAVFSSANGLQVDKVNATTQANVPNTTTGTRDTGAVNGTRLQNDLDAYVSMVRTTGNQTIEGIKAFTDFVGDGGIKVSRNNYAYVKLINTDADVENPQGNKICYISMTDKNQNVISNLRYVLNANGTGKLEAEVRNSNGTFKYVTIAQGDVI